MLLLKIGQFFINVVCSIIIFPIKDVSYIILQRKEERSFVAQKFIETKGVRPTQLT